MKTVLLVYLPDAKCWIPARVQGTNWDVDQMRTQYRASGLCTAVVRVHAA